MEKLNAVQSNGTQVLVIPGNHDLNSAAGDYNPAEPILVESTSEKNFLSMYENFGLTQAISRDENLLHFNEYSFWYFEETGRLQTHDAFLESDLSKSEKKLLADTFARINAHYFVGDRFSLQEYSDGIQLWHDQENNFISRYIDTMVQEAEVDNQTLYININ